VGGWSGGEERRVGVFIRKRERDLGVRKSEAQEGKKGGSFMSSNNHRRYEYLSVCIRGRNT